MLEARFYVGLRDKETHEQHYEVEKYKEKNGAERDAKRIEPAKVGASPLGGVRASCLAASLRYHLQKATRLIDDLLQKKTPSFSLFTVLPNLFNIPIARDRNGNRKHRK
jgi:hypothetical protein